MNDSLMKVFIFWGGISETFGRVRINTNIYFFILSHNNSCVLIEKGMSKNDKSSLRTYTFSTKKHKEKCHICKNLQV